MNTARLRSTIAAIIGALAVVGPQILNLLGTWQSPKAAVVTSAVGFIVALAINGKAVALLNIFLPPAPTAAPDNVVSISEATTKAETPNSKASS